MNATPNHEDGVADILERAADEMERRGFTKGQWVDDVTGCVCAEGALHFAGAADRFILAILRVLNPFGPVSGDWHSIDDRAQSATQEMSHAG